MNYKKRNLLKRACALFLVLVMCVGMLQITAFALDENEEEPQIEEPDSTSGGGASDNQELDSPEPGGDDVDDGIEPESEPEPAPEPEADEVITNPAVVNDHEPVEIPAESAPVPGDANENTTVTNTTDPVTGNETESIETDKTWGSSSESKGEFSEKEDVSEDPDESGIVDVLTGDDAEDNLDNIEDGTYTKTEEQHKTDTEVTVSGNETRTDETTRDPDGNLVSDSFELEGQQTTTVTDTDTTRTTTTTVEKTTEKEKEDGTKTPGRVTDVGEKKEVGDTVIGNQESDTETDPTKKSTTESGAAVDPSGITVTLGPDNKTDEHKLTPVVEQPNDEDTKAALKDLAGYDLVDADGNSLGTIQDDGTVLRPDGTPYKPTWVQENGSWKLVIDAEKVNPEETVKTENVVTNSKSEASTVEGDSGVPTMGEWVKQWDKETLDLEDGTTIETYVQKGTGVRVDVETWKELSNEILYKQQVTDKTNKTIVVSPGEKGSVVGEWTDATPGAENGTLHLQTIQPAQSKYNLMNAWENHLGMVHNPGKADNTKPSDGWLKYDGYSLYSTLMIGSWKDTDKDGKYNEDFHRTTYVHLFQLTDKAGNHHYVYCADMSTDAKINTKYEMVNVKDSTYYNAADAERLQAIAENGYWGTADGNKKNPNQGSLAAVKALLTDKNKKYQKFIDDGIALAVTQAAIWTYGDKTDRELAEKNNQTEEKISSTIFQFYSKKNGEAGGLSQNEMDAAMALYNALINSKSSSTPTDIVDAEDIKGGSITVKEKIESQEQLDNLVAQLNTEDKKQDKPKFDAASENEYYNTDVSFTVAVVPSRVNGDVIVYVYQGDKPVASKRLDDSTAKTDANGNTTYTIPNVPLKEGVNISLKLEGTQNLSAGAYIYRSDAEYSKSQTFIGLSTGDSTRDVNLEFGMKFTANDGKTSTKTSTTNSETTDTWTETTPYEQEKRQETEVEELYTNEVTITTTVKVVDEIDTTVDRTAVQWSDNAINYYSITDSGDDDDDDDDITTTTEGDDDDDDTTTVPEDPTPLAEVPAETAPLAEVPDEETPLTEVPDEETPLEEIPDEETPLAEVPATGDDPTLLYAMSALCAASLMGLAALSLKKRQEM